MDPDKIPHGFKTWDDFNECVYMETLLQKSEDELTDREKQELSELEEKFEDYFLTAEDLCVFDDRDE